MSLQHVAVIMDGNGRWAQQKGFVRTKGHREGLTTAKKIVKTAAELQIPYITLYVFSTENWKRTAGEVSFLMGLIKKHLRAERNFYAENKIRVKHIGGLSQLSPEIQAEIRATEELTRDYTGTTVQLAINYGGKDEIIRAVKKLNAETLASLTEDTFETLLDTGNAPPVDLLIRTGGENRLSNFLLWQTAYAEWYVTATLWPDFTEEDFKKAVEAYTGRTRRFGGVV